MAATQERTLEAVSSRPWFGVMRPPWAALLGLSSKDHRSFHKLADARRDADQQVGGWLLHGEHLDDAFRGLFGRSLAIESSFARLRQSVPGARPLSIAAMASSPIPASAAMSAEIGSAPQAAACPFATAANRS